MELELGDVDAVEDAVEFGVEESGVEFGDDVGFVGGEFGAEGAVHAGDGVIVGEIVDAGGEGARERSTDRTELRGFEQLGVVSNDDIDSIGAGEKAVGEVARFDGIIIKDGTNAYKYREENNTNDDEFDGEASRNTRRFGFDRTIRLGDFVEILKVIHKTIVTYYLWLRRSLGNERGVV